MVKELVKQIHKFDLVVKQINVLLVNLKRLLGLPKP
jgi:hypothetical protein